MSAAVAARDTVPRPALARGALGALALSQGVVGGWALLLPSGFYAAFPAAGHAWVALLPPYNEHLVRDVGGLGLALAVLLAVAAAVPTPLLVRTAVAAFATAAVPHTAFHAMHLDGFPAADAAAQTAGFAVQLLLAAAALASAGRERR